MMKIFPFLKAALDNFCRYDFFLVSQSVRQGTVSPTHYNILYDSVGWTPDQVQKLTYLLTHLYFNWQVSILLVIEFCTEKGLDLNMY